VSLNTAVQLYFVLGILHSAGKYTWSRKNRLTHLVAKTSAASAVLYTWRTWGAVTIGVCRLLLPKHSPIVSLSRRLHPTPPSNNKCTAE
jgi:peptidoglycan biosynthesis protein MviN/MurJ (putative lipid II flippase)